MTAGLQDNYSLRAITPLKQGSKAQRQ